MSCAAAAKAFVPGCFSRFGSPAPQLLSQWLIPRIASFYQRYPEIEVHFQPLTQISQLRSEHVDVLILSHGEPLNLT